MKAKMELIGPLFSMPDEPPHAFCEYRSDVNNYKPTTGNTYYSTIQTYLLEISGHLQP